MVPMYLGDKSGDEPDRVSPTSRDSRALDRQRQSHVPGAALYLEQHDRIHEQVVFVLFVKVVNAHLLDFPLAAHRQQP